MDKAKEIANKNSHDFTDLCDIMAILRSENGCPWDKEQTHKSIRGNLIEETYEAVEAIDTDDIGLLREELGDVLQQVVFHSRIAEESNEFDISDVIGDLCKKLIERHPHIFGDVEVENTDEVLVNWEKIKQASKGRDTIRENLEGVSKALPSLMRAAKIAKKSGYQVDDLKIDLNDMNIGEALFKIAAHAECNKMDAEQALFDYCNEFIENF